ncbi:hypothetical protein Scep_015848 [Stephania cephalantha]|uniref:non-specific serine/threonine protein kinase n=1 Tax=Stephania cephalantha TaxID=152367 RepID=A0AAP0J3K7_9MAGN
MLLLLLLLLLLLFVTALLVPVSSSQQQQQTTNNELGFIYNGFHQSATNSLISTDGVAEITSKGLLRLTNETKQQKGHAFYTHPFQFKDPSTRLALSFSTTFVFAIATEIRDLSGHGIVFVISPSKTLPGSLPSQFLGLFNKTSNGDPSNHVVGVELDTIYSSEFNDPNDNHVGIDINSLASEVSAPAGFHVDDATAYNNGGFRNLSLISGDPMQVWIDYDGSKKQLNVTLAPIDVPNKPKIPLLSLSRDLSPILLDAMYVGFSSATGSVFTSHYILGWSFKMRSTEADAIDLSALPKVPRIGPKKKSKLPTIGVPILVAIFVLLTSYGIYYLVKRRRKFAEIIEDWELIYGPQRFKYKDLYIATKGFKEKELLGTGGFGSVYRGVLRGSKTEVAVKRVSHESRQGVREFIAEIVSMGQLRHRNLVQLLGYCRRKGELILVYDFMPNGSLDKLLFGPVGSATLNWGQRLHVIKGVATGLLYLHEEWEQVVIHRDIKASNVLLDGELNGRLGDFGLARLYDHGVEMRTTHVVGTPGYLAPELARNGKATKRTDVYAFGIFVMEVVCGKRPIFGAAEEEEEEEAVLVDWVVSCWNKGAVLQVVDPRLSGGSGDVKEMELALKVGLLCSHAVVNARPSMRQVVQFLEGDVAPTPLPANLDSSFYCGMPFPQFGEGFDHSYPSSSDRGFVSMSSVTDSILSTGR